MYFYTLSNDLRVQELDKWIEACAYKNNLGEWPEYLLQEYPIENKTLKNVPPVIEFYLGLNKESHVNQLAELGEYRRIIINFIKKFQFPNPRNKKHLSNYLNNDITLAPARTIVKLLYIGFLTEGKTGYLTLDEILNFIYFNPEVSKNKDFSIVELYQEIIGFRKDPSTKDFNFLSDDEKSSFWRDFRRQSRDLMNILMNSKIVILEGDKYKLRLSNLTTQEKSDVFEILTENNYWIPSQALLGENLEGIDSNFKEIESSYFEYFDIDSNSDEKVAHQIRESEGSYLEDFDVNFNGVEEAVNHKGFDQKIYFGPPGTGKSHKVTEEILKLYPKYAKSGSANVFRTSIHPDYSYHDFIGHIMPVSEKDTNGDSIIKYEFTTGIFTDALIQAYNHPTENIFLVLEEMSRGNIIAIFGDLFQLLDREVNGESSYAIDNKILIEKINEVTPQKINELKLPANLSIYGTLNTSDQNVYPIDNAFKRRFEFEYISSEPIPNLNNVKIKIGEYETEWNIFYIKLNTFILDNLRLSEDKQIGQFFIKFKELDNTYNQRQVLNKLLQYLWEDVHLVSMSGESLFKENITNFGVLYNTFKNGENVFSEVFLDQLEQIENSGEASDEG